MKGESHERAQKLLVAARVEGLSAADQAWLDSHLTACAGCTAQAESLERAVAALRSFQAPVNPAIVDETHRRLHLRAQELREHEARMWALGLACALSWVVGVLTAPLVWWGLEWIGEHVGIPKPVWVGVFLISWVMPAVVIAAVLTWRREFAAARNGDPATMLR
jgi:anti-sigma factor RsiW